LGSEAEQHLWLRGGFPLSYLAGSNVNSIEWRKNFIQTLLERDFPQWGVRIAATALQRFWTMVAHYHGQVWNSAEPARALGVSESTIRRYLDLLTDAFMIRQLQPYHANLKKRQVKSPKIYVRDSGLLHQLLGIDSMKNLFSHPKMGASWEGFVIEQLLHTEPYDEVFFWASHQGAEIDLILRRGDAFYGVECKRTDTPRLTPSMRIALDDLNLRHVFIIYPGIQRFPLASRVEAVPLQTMAKSASLLNDL
jgi:predicted AAA+ superfamily ATPase